MISEEAYLTPSDLAVTPVSIRRVVVIGQCTAAGLLKFLGSALADNAGFASYLSLEHKMFLNFSDVSDLEHPVEEYDLQILVPPLRSIMPDIDFMRRDDVTAIAAQTSLEISTERLRLFFEYGTRFNQSAGLLTFVSNFVVPQQDSTGRFCRRYDLRNITFFVETLNKRLSDIASQYTSCYVLDADKIACSLGKQHFLDDVITAFNHNGIICYGPADNLDSLRIEEPTPIEEIFDLRGEAYFRALAREIAAMYRTVRQVDQVKLVVVDLDDTLWRGVTAEGFFHHNPLEGWPLGLIESLLILKRRGIMLAISSKNSEDNVRSFWDSMFHGRLLFSDFVSVRINWEPKTENMEAILTDVNVLPNSVIFIDDNPVERAAMQAAYPDIRVLGADLYRIRTILLNAPETQVTVITDESSQRTTMVQSQIKRETARATLTREDFLRSLNVNIDFFEVREGDIRFDRTVELINRTNQFNTAGIRRSTQELKQLISDGAHVVVFDVEDRFSRYGTVGCIIIVNEVIEQFVMSCRVFGLGVEFAALSHVPPSVSRLGSNLPSVTNPVEKCTEVWAAQR